MTRLRILTGPRKTFEPTSSSQIKSNATDNIKKHEVLIEIYKITNVMTKILSMLEISKTESIMESIQSKCNLSESVLSGWSRIETEFQR